MFSLILLTAWRLSSSKIQYAYLMPLYMFYPYPANNFCPENVVASAAYSKTCLMWPFKKKTKNWFS